MKEINDSKVQSSVKEYISRARKSKDFLTDSISVSSNELGESLSVLVKKPNFKGAFQLASDIVGSGAWISNSYLNLLLTITGLTKPKEQSFDPDDHQFIIELLNLGSSTSLPGPLSSFLEGGRQRTQEKRKEEIFQNNRKQS